jgi:ABC-type branched-subunit amino acid transport system ATPase component
MDSSGIRYYKTGGFCDFIIGRANVGETTILQRVCIAWKKQHGWAKLESADTMDYATTKEAGRCK